MHKFIVRTNHLAITYKYLKHLKNLLKTRIGRWALKLQEYDCKILYRAGSKNVIADCLSRKLFEKVLDTTEIVEIPTFGVTAECTEQKILKLVITGSIKGSL